MGRWSPTVVAEANPAPRSGLSQALSSGMDAYEMMDRGRDRRRQQEMEQQRLDELAQYRQDELARRAKEDEVTAFNRRATMQQNGWTETDPSQSPAEAASAGAQDSAPVPSWYSAEQERIKRQAEEMFPGSGVQQQRDPQTGQTYYLPVKRQFIQSEMSKLDAERRKREEAEAKANAEGATWEKREKISHANRLELERVRAQLRPPPRGRAAGEDEETDDLDKEYAENVRNVGGQIDDARSGVSSATSMSRELREAGGYDAAQGQLMRARGEQARLSQLETQRTQLTQGGRQGFRRSRADQDLGNEVGNLSRQIAEIWNRPDLDPRDRAELQKAYQKQADDATARNRSRYKVGTSPLGKAMR